MAPPAPTGLGLGRRRGARPRARGRLDARGGLEVTRDPAGNMVGRLARQRAGSARGLERIASRHAARRRALRRRARRAQGARRRRGDRRRRPAAPRPRGHRLPARGGPALRARRVRQPRDLRAARATTRAICATPTASRWPRRSRRSATASCRAPAGSSRRPRASSSRTSSRARRSRRRARRSASSARSPAWPGLELTFTGRRGHAGTVQMPLRSDALGAAARFVVDAHDVARSLPGCGRHDRPADGRAGRDEHDSRALRAVRRPARAGRRAASTRSSTAPSRPRARPRRPPPARSRSSRAGATRRSR